MASAPSAILARDLNRDGHIDLAATDLQDNVVVVLQGKGDGSFEAARSYATGSKPSAIVAADFNEDGWPDLATANNGVKTVSVLLNTTAP